MNKSISILRAPVLQACCRRGARIQRTAMLLLATLLLTMTAQTAWADTWPEYITDVILVGGTESEVNAAKAAHSDYTFISQDLNKGCGSSSDYIYLGYKKGYRASTNGGYITDIIVVTEGSNDIPTGNITFSGRTYNKAAIYGGNYFVNPSKGDLNSHAGGWGLWLYYTKANFSDKRAISSISFSSTQSGSVNCYKYWNEELAQEGINMNRGCDGGDNFYMHLSTTTKTNRPKTDPVMASGLVYNGSEQMLVASMGTTYDNTYFMSFREIGGNQYFYQNTAQFTKATNAGTYNVEYYAGSGTYGNQSATKSHQVTIAKSANSGVTVACADVVDGNAPAPQLGGTNLSTGAVTYQYSTTQNGTYTTTVPTDFGKYWVKATIAGDDNCYAYTTAAVSFWILSDANDLWNIKGGANGTVDHPIVISTPSQLDLLAKTVNGTDGYTANNYSGQYFELGADIAYDKTVENNFTVIGNYSNDKRFTGYFDGKGHTISGININLPSTDYVGLFASVSYATIQNLTLANSTICGGKYVGGIVGSGGSKDTTIQNCHVGSDVTVSGTNYVGGIVGLYGTIRGCTGAATVTGNIVGGITGTANYSVIENCLVYGGTVNGTNAGAIAGTNNNSTGTLTNNHYTRVMLNNSEAWLDKGVGGDGSQDGTRYICAIIPYEGVTLSIPSVSATTEYPYDGLKIYPTGMTYKGQYYNYISNADAGISGDVTFTATYSGSVPEDHALGGFGSTSIADNKNVEMEWEATDGSATCTLCTGYAAIYYIAPTFRNAIWGDGDGTQGNPYIIKTVRGMNELASRVNSGEDLGGKYFELGADITYDGTENNYTPIGTSDHPFSANFDGKGYTISGINITNKNSYANPIAGIFGYAKSCTIQNITLANSTFSKTGHTGGIFSSGERVTVSNCHVTNTVTLDDMLGQSFSGGIGGYAEYSNIQGCTNDATMTYRYYESGGIMGCMRGGTIKDCLYLGPKINAEWNRFILYVIMNATPTISNSYYISYGETPRYGGVFAVATTDKPEGASETATATYGSGSYTGITVFGNVLYYDGKYYWHDENLMELADRNEDNSSIIAGNNRQTRNVVLKDRTLYKDGSWNTLCLPFAVDLNATDCPLFGATARTVTAASISGSTLNLTFGDGDAVNTLVAGTPYIIKWDGDGTSNIENPVFEGVTIDATNRNYDNGATGDTRVRFCGTYKSTAFDAEDKSILLMGAENTLFYPITGSGIGAQRAYFKIGDELLAPSLTAFNIDFGEGDNATGIISITSEARSNADGWYSLDGHKLAGKPTVSGIYINNGKKVVIK